MAEADHVEFGRQARRRLDAVRAGTASLRDGSRGTGKALDGQVTVVAANGRVVSVELAPRLMRSAPAELGAALLTAVNAALDDLREQAGEHAPDALVRRLEEARDQSLRSMSRIADELGEIVARVAPRHAGPDSPLDRLRANLEAARPSRDDTDLHGEGTAGPVRAVVLCGGRVSVLDLDGRAMRMTSPDLAEGVRAAVNAALDDLEAQAHERVGPSGDPSPQHLRDLLSGIQKP